MPKRRKLKKKKKNSFKPPARESEASSTENDGVESVRALRCTIPPFDYDLNPIENYKVIMEDLKTVLIYILNENTELIDATESVIAILERRNSGGGSEREHAGKLVVEKYNDNVIKLTDEEINNEIIEEFSKGINIDNDESDIEHSDKNIAEKNYAELNDDNTEKEDEQCRKKIEEQIDDHIKFETIKEIEKGLNEKVVEQFFKNVNEKYNKLIQERLKKKSETNVKFNEIADQQIEQKVWEEKDEKKLEYKQFDEKVGEQSEHADEKFKQDIDIKQISFEEESDNENYKKVELNRILQLDESVQQVDEQIGEHVDSSAQEQNNEHIEHPAWIQFVEKISMEVNKKMEVEDQSFHQQFDEKVDSLVNKQELVDNENIDNPVAIEIPIKPLSESDIRKYCRNILQYEDNVRHLRDRFSTKSQETLRALRDSRDNYGKTNIVLTHEVMFNHQPSRKQIGRLKNLQEAETLFETLVCNTKNVEKVRKISLDLCCVGLSKSMRTDFEQGKCTLDNLRCLQKRLQAVQNGIDVVEKELQDIEFGWRMFISL